MELKLLSLVSLGIDIEVGIENRKLSLKFFELSSGDFIELWEGDNFNEADEQINDIIQQYSIDNYTV